jgi:hypothetical protein
MKARQSGQVLIILVSWMLFGGSGIAAGVFLTGKPVDELRKETHAIAAQKDRRKRIDEVLDRWEKDAKQFAKQRKELLDTLPDLLGRHDAKPGDFEQLYVRADALNTQTLETLLEVRFALRRQFSAEEWRKLFGDKAS